MLDSSTSLNADARLRAIAFATKNPILMLPQSRRLYSRLPRKPQLQVWPGFDVGQIVSFRFPHFDKPDEITRDTSFPRRPCLVVEADPEEKTVLLAYGTSRWNNSNRGYEICVRQEADLCGLGHPTRFVLARRLRVFADDSRFFHGSEDGPARGRLTSDLHGRLNDLFIKLRHAYRDDEEVRHVHDWIGADRVADHEIVRTRLNDM
jgi:hypothetical protein